MPSYSREECAAAAAKVNLPMADDLRQVVAALEAVETQRQELLDQRSQLTRELFERKVSRQALAGLTGLTPDGVDAARRRE